MASMGRGGGRGPWTHWLGEDRKTETEEAGTTTWAQNCAKRRVEEHLEPRRTSLLTRSVPLAPLQGGSQRSRTT